MMANPIGENYTLVAVVGGVLELCARQDVLLAGNCFVQLLKVT